MTPAEAQEQEVRDLYRELILDHARNPRHFGKLENATHTADGINPLCGDKLRLYVDVDATQKIREVAFEGTGCAISVASASLLTETVVGLGIRDAISYFESVTAYLTGSSQAPRSEPIDLGKLRALEGVRDFPARVKCATLAWHALRSALTGDSVAATTE